MPVQTTALYMDGVNSTNGAGSKLKIGSTGLTARTVTVSLPGTTNGSPCYSSAVPTRSGQTMSSTVYPTSGLGIHNVPRTGQGWFLEETGLDGNRPYYDGATPTSFTVDFANWSGSYGNANLYVRFSSYKPSTGEYTFLGTIYDVTTAFQQNRNGTGSVITFNTAYARAKLDPDCLLYVDLIFYYTTGTQTARTVDIVTGNAISTIGLVNRPQSEVAPPNDHLAGAYNMTGVSGNAQPAFGQNPQFCTYETGETENAVYGTGWAANYDGPGSQWFKWTCPVSGAPASMYFSLGPQRSGFYTDPSGPYAGQGVSICTRMRVYTSSSPSSPTYASLTQIADITKSGGETYQGSPDWWSDYTLDSPIPGETYFFQVMTQNQIYDSGSPHVVNTGNYFTLTISAIKITWSGLYRGAWNVPADITYDYADLGTIGGWGNGDAPGMAGATPFHQIKEYHGYTAIWQAGGYPDPCQDSYAYEVATKRCNTGDQSIDETGNNSEFYWGAPPYIPNVFRMNGTQVWDMGGSAQYSGVGTGEGAPPAGATCGGLCSISPQQGLIGGIGDWQTFWSFVVFNPIGLAYDSQAWAFTGSLPSGAVDIVYSKQCADIVSFKVRPAAVGGSEHPASGSFGSTIVGEWWELPNNSPTAPEFGIYRRSSDNLLVCRTNCPPGGYPIAHPSDMRTMAGVQLIGSLTFVKGAGSAGSRTSIDTTWTSPPQYQYLELLDADTFTAADEYYAGFGVDFIFDDATMGYQGGTPSWSFSRYIWGQDLEFEIVLKRPCYAFIYTTEQYDIGATVFTSDCSVTTGWTQADPFAIVSGRFQFVTSPQDAYQDLGAAEDDIVEAEFDFEPPADLSGMGGGEFVSFYEGGSATRHVYGNLANLTGTVTWQVGAGTVLTSTGLVTAGSHTYKVQVRVHDTLGFVRVYKDGVLHSQVNNVDVRNGGTDGLIDRVLFGAHGNTTYLDNVSISTLALVNDSCPPLEVPPATGPEPPLRLKQRDDDNGINTEGSQSGRIATNTVATRRSSEQRSTAPRIQTRNGMGYR